MSLNSASKTHEVQFNGKKSIGKKTSEGQFKS